MARIKPHEDQAVALRVARMAVGALAVGALAVGALPIGYLAIGALNVSRARSRRLEIDELIIRHARRTPSDATTENEFG
jgi:ABC-type taurine transport system substrate-binding protein